MPPKSGSQLSQGLGSSFTNLTVSEARKPQELSGDINAAVKFHALCEPCKSLCELSPLLSGRFEGKYPWESRDDPPFDDTSSDPELQEFKLEEEYLLDSSVAELEASASAGCHLCSLFWHNLTYDVYNKLEEESEAELRDYGKRIKQGARDFLRVLDSGPHDMRPAIAVRVGSGSRGSGPRGVLALYPCLYDGRALPQVRSTLLILDSEFIDRMYGEAPGRRAARASICTASDATFALAEKWIAGCTTQHGPCRASRTRTSAPPPRILDLGTSVSDPVRLHVTSDGDRDVKYVALSHCWGGAAVFKLTSKTLPDMLKGIPLSCLPPTFVDTITICRRLEIRYLWIDALCIVQDDINDWRSHSTTMGKIYQNCIFSIAALGASNSSEGCFTRRDPLSYTPLKLPVNDNLTITKCTAYPWHDEKFTRTPLLQRGWVIQERCFAPATLYFGKFGIQWECQQDRADETQDRTTLFLASGDIELKKTMDQLRLSSLDMASSAQVYKFYRPWHEVIAQYSSADLTFKSDKLIAIAGIVEFVQQQTGLTSFAGLWEELLLKELLWSVPDPLECSRSEVYRAPSFTWASIDGTIRHEFYQFHDYSRATGRPHMEEEYLANIIEKHVTTVDSTRTSGQVTDGFIRIRGPVKEISLLKMPEQSGWDHPFGAVVKDGVVYPWFVPDTAAVAQLATLDAVCLTIARWTEPQHEFDSNSQVQKEPVTASRTCHVAGIVLQPINGAGENAYKRIGFFEDCYRSEEPQWWEVAGIRTVVIS